MKRIRKNDAGFSLLETLLGLTLTAMVGLLMMGSMQMGARVWEHNRSAKPPGADELLLGQVSEWLGQAMPASVRDSGDSSLAPFRGDESGMTFQYSATALGGSPGLYTVSLKLAPDETCPGKSDLYLETSRMVSSTTGQAAVPAPESRRLLACIANASFSYWSRLDAGLSTAWRPQWIDSSDLPSLVRLRTIDENGAERALITQPLLRAPR